MVTVNSGATSSSRNDLVPTILKPLQAVKKDNGKAKTRKGFVAAPSYYPLAARILRLPEVIHRIGLKRASIYAHMTQGTFPKQIAIGIRAVGWLEHEIDAWLQARVFRTGV
jgi:prophage regulatory protein